MRLAIAKTWRGEAIPVAEQAFVGLELADDGDLIVRIDAPLHGDPVPRGAPGPTAGLWDFEVVELFILGPEERYLELEFGPCGHHLVLRLEGRRSPVEVGLALEYSAVRTGDLWSGIARVPRSYLPDGPHRINAYAIHGVADERRYLCWKPTMGEAPDFHRLEVFEAVELS